MKTCLLCNTDAPDDAATCPNDGEASWSVTVAPVAVVPADDDVDTKRNSRRVPR